MAEYIEREAFLAEKRHLYCENCARRKNGKGKFVYDIGDAPCRACDIMDVLDAVEDFPAADVRPVKWIPVTERLPEKMQYVLVRYQNNDMAVASWFGGDEHIRFWRAMTDEGWCADCDTEPTHWMPLPEPPKEE